MFAPPDLRQEIDIPFERQSEIGLLDLESIVEESEKVVESHLPGASFQSLAFLTRCETFPSLSGKLSIIFSKPQINPISYPPVATDARIHIDFDRSISELVIDTLDYRETWVSQKPSNSEFSSATSMAISYLEENALEECEFEFVRSLDSWEFICWGEMQCSEIVSLEDALK